MHTSWPALEDEVSCFSEVSPVVSCHPRGEDATLLLPFNASCVLLPALEFACAHGEPIQGADPSEIPGYPTAHCPPSCPNQPSVGCRGQVAGAAPLGQDTTARTVRNLSSSPTTCPLASSFGSTGESRPRKWKADLSKLRGTSDIDGDNSSRDHQRASRALKELQGEERRMYKPLYAKERDPAWLQPPGWSLPPVPAKRGAHPRRCIELSIDLLTRPTETQVCLMFQKCPFVIFFKTLSIVFPLWQTAQIKSVSGFL